MVKIKILAIKAFPKLRIERSEAYELKLSAKEKLEWNRVAGTENMQIAEVASGYSHSVFLTGRTL